MSYGPSPDRDRRIGRQVGRERAQVDRLHGRKQNPEALDHPVNASPAYIDGLRQGYREEIEGNAPLSLEDF